MQYLSASLEDYLEIIYILKQSNENVGITDISRALSLSKPSVNRAMKILKDQGLVFQEKYGKIDLTEKGIYEAENIYDKHKILSRFLTQILGVSTRTAEIDACRIEHILSRETIANIKSFLKRSN